MAVKEIKDMGASVLSRLKNSPGKRELIIRLVSNCLHRRNFFVNWKYPDMPEILF